MAVPVKLNAAQARQLSARNPGLAIVAPTQAVRTPKPASGEASKAQARFLFDVSTDTRPAVRAAEPILHKAYLSSPGQAILSLAMIRRWGDLVALEHRPLPERMIRLDSALPEYRIAVEVNGWSNHGQRLSSFQSDHRRTRDLMVAGWRVIPFTANEARSETDDCLSVIAEVIDQIKGVV